jgi:hypothetical protein
MAPASLSLVPFTMIMNRMFVPFCLDVERARARSTGAQKSFRVAEF